MLTPIDLLPAKVVWSLASSYIAGTNEKEALNLAKKLYEQNKFASTVDILGEAASSAEQCETYVDKCISVINLANADPLPDKNKQRQPTLSFKPSMFCICKSPDLLPPPSELAKGYDRISRIVKYAYEKNIDMTIEAEQNHWADFQLETYFSLLNAGYTNLGTVLQTRLYRVANDIKRFDSRARVRLVIGIYEENSSVAHTNKRQMKELLIDYSAELLKKGAYVQLATHDANYVEKFFTNIVLALGIKPDQFETQFLLGVPRLKLQQMLISGEYFELLERKNLISNKSSLQLLRQSGTVVRLYLPFGEKEIAGPYCKRRLKTNPNLLLYGLKNLVGVQ